MRDDRPYRPSTASSAVSSKAPAHPYPPVTVLGALALALGSAVLTLVGCDGSAPTQVRPQRVMNRVVSLAPALTRMIVDLGAEEELVAVAENDFAAPRGVTTVGRYPDFDSEALISVRPTHVLMMAGPGEPPEHLQNLADNNGFLLVTYPDPESLTDVGLTLYDRPAADKSPSVAEGLGREPVGRRLREQGFIHKILRMQQLVEDRQRVRVLMVMGTNPVRALGMKTVHGDLLSIAINADNAASFVSDETAPVLERELVLEAAPDVILLLLPNKRSLGSIDDDPMLAEFRGLDIAAVTNSRIVLINDPLAQLPSTSLVRIGVAMAKAIHPDLAEEFDKILGTEDLWAPPADLNVQTTDEKTAATEHAATDD